MSTVITIHDIPAEVHAELESRAAMRGWPLEEFVRHELIRLGVRPTRRVDVATVRAATVGHPPLSLTEILAARHTPN